MNPEEHQTVFSTTKQEYRNSYFINSADRIGYFFEDGALDNDGKLVVDKQKSLNKIGHALHVFCPNFKRITHSAKVKKVVQDLSFKEPRILQSMYIFKQPKIGGEVTSHQDASFLYTQPLDDKVVGLWIALEDATLENGCLWFWPGSHKSGLYGQRRMIRNPEKTGQACIFKGEKIEYDQEKFIPVPVKAGDCVLLHNLVAHKSGPNKSSKSRHIYAFHVCENKDVEWSKENWLQETEAKTFTYLYKEDQ